eukprot:13479524-Alexandrium_andersonii.AAC.1
MRARKRNRMPSLLSDLPPASRRSPAEPGQRATGCSAGKPADRPGHHRSEIVAGHFSGWSK